MYQFAETWLVPVQLFLAMIGMGATISVRDFALIGKHPAGLALGLGLQLLVVPAVAMAFIVSLNLNAGWAIGLLLLALVPGGATSNLFTFLARGSAPLSIAVTLSTTLVSMGSIPLYLSLLAPEFLPADFQVPTARIARDIVIFLLGPLALGMVIYRILPKHRDRFATWCIRLSLLCVLIIALAAIGSGRMDVIAYGWRPPVTIFAFGCVISLIALVICKLARRFDDDTTALTIEVTVRNTAIALLIVPFFFKGLPEQSHVLYSALFYAGISGLVMLPTLLLNRSGRSPLPGTRPHKRPLPTTTQADQPG